MFESPLTNEKLENILTSLRIGLEHLMGNRLDAVYLYGSQARGEARPDSDIDVLVVLREDFEYGQMLDLTSELTWKLSLENNVVISLVFSSKEQFDLINTPFLLNVHREARPLRRS